MTDPLAEYGPVAPKRKVVSIAPIPEGEWRAFHGWKGKDPDPMYPEWCEITLPADNGRYAYSGSISSSIGIRTARLIAAAPNLRRALINLLSHPQGPEAVKCAAAALRKAETGE